MRIVTTTTLELNEVDRTLLHIADNLRETLRELNEFGIPLDRGFTPRDDERAGAYWYAQEALREVLVQLSGEQEIADRILHECIDNGESVTYTVNVLFA